MKEEILEQIGFSKNEAKVYLSLLELGSATAGEISKKCKVHRTNTYDSLDSLGKKGIVAHFLKNDIKYFEAVDPDNLMNLLQEKELALQQVMPQLKMTHQFMHLKTDASVSEGLKSIREVFNNFLTKKKTIYCYGVPPDAHKKINTFIGHFHKKRISEKIEMKHIYNYGADERVKYLNSLPYTESKVFPKEFDSPVSTMICGDEVILISWEDQMMAIKIKSEEMANSYTKYFKILLEIAKNN